MHKQPNFAYMPPSIWQQIRCAYAKKYIDFQSLRQLFPHPRGTVFVQFVSLVTFHNFHSQSGVCWEDRFQERNPSVEMNQRRCSCLSSLQDNVKQSVIWSARQ